MIIKKTSSTIYRELYQVTLTPWEIYVLQEAIALASINATTDQIVISGKHALRENVGIVMRNFCVLPTG